MYYENYENEYLFNIVDLLIDIDMDTWRIQQAQCEERRRLHDKIFHNGLEYRG